MGSVITALESPAVARTGVVRIDRNSIKSKIADGAVPAGVIVTGLSTGGRFAKVPTTAAEVDSALGGAIFETAKLYRDGAAENADGDPFDVLADGEMTLTSETAMLEGGDVYVRFDVNTTEQRGAIRNTSDGGSSVTITSVVATNSSLYAVQLDGIPFSITADSSTSNDEIATALAAAIDAHADYTATALAAVVTVARVSGADITVNSHDPRLTVASLAKARKLAGARVASDCSGAGPCAVSLKRA